MYRGESLRRITGTVDGGKLWGQKLEDRKRENLTFPSVSFLFYVNFPTSIHALHLIFYVSEESLGLAIMSPSLLIFICIKNL